MECADDVSIVDHGCRHRRGFVVALARVPAHHHTMRFLRAGSLPVVLCVAMAMAASAAACGSDGSGSVFQIDGGGDGSLADAGDQDGTVGDEVRFGDDSSSANDGNAFALTVEPVDAIVDVTSGQPIPSKQYVAKANGAVVAAAFSIDRGEIGVMNVASGLLAPKGTLGGKAKVTATYKGKSASTSVTVRLHVVQNGGGAQSGDAGGGAGGNGGVGGEGSGGAVPPGTQTVLDGSPAADPGLAFLYPYDGTVWPRGILAPLLQWSPGAKSYDAVSIHISEAAYDYKGYFAKTATPFIHHPVPQDIWKQLAYSNGGEDVTVSLVFSSGGAAYGPITQKWKVAAGALKGTVYYNSYGTNLAHSYCCTTNNQRFGAATLAIRGGSTDPTLIAGSDTACRVCHTVSADGSRLITQQDNNNVTSMYDLVNANAETTMTPGDGRFSWGALYPNGSFLFSNSAPQQAGNTTLASQLYAVPSGAAIASSGLPANLKAACPAFSPDGKHVALNFYGGAGADQKSLAVMDFAQPSTFSGFTSVHTPSAGTAVWPTYLPTNDGLVFQLETVYNGRDFAGTRSQCDSGGACSNAGTHGELWWLDLKTSAHAAVRLDKLNGKGYLPTGPNAHDDDTTLNYEPTVNPVPSGGYAWVVFTSRRLYGNVATINPFWSDPRYHDISVAPTPKKLWVAAIDLNAPPGTDPSHPAFYLPAQELLAGNSRGFWVVDPCQKNGSGCETGDECCGGFCRPGGDAGALICTDTVPTCAEEFEKCITTADCCGASAGIQCINGRCATPVPR
jgi:hypothetical protein